MKPLALAALLAAALLAPAAQAQTPTGVTLAVAAVGEVPFEGSGSIPFTAQVGCAELAQNEPLTATVPDAPAWMAVTPAEVAIAPTAAPGCIPGGSIELVGAIAFTVAADAPGVVPHTIDVVASVGDTQSPPVSATFTVAYNVNYTVVPAAQFPLTVTNATTTFQVTATQASNARSMIMIEQVAATAGVFSGLASTVYEVRAGAPASKTFDVTFKAPEGEWTEATVSFKAFGHYLLESGEANDYSPAQEYSWTFVNGGVEERDHGDGKESPAPVGALTALGLLGFAALRRRKA